MQHRSDNQHGDLYEQLMAISQEALTNQYYETAYHSLAAAMHYAQAVGNAERLQAVASAAKEQQDLIDTQTPKHRMATQAAVNRDRISLYQMLARQASAQVLIVQHKHRQEDTPHLPWFGDLSSK